MKTLSRRLLALAAFCAVGFADPASAERRIALVIGNSAYTAFSPLDNPARDATLISKVLTEAGFEVTALTDAKRGDLAGAISGFGRALREAGPEVTGLFYFAGHGVQSFGTNYLLPVDLELADQADLDLVAVQAQSVLRQMASAGNATNIVILDACRNNPFQTARAIDDNGLAEMQAPTGTFLAYAAAPGALAYDGSGANSPFTTALAREIPRPGLQVEQIFKNVRVAVLDATGGRQTPWDTSSLTREFTFTPSGRTPSGEGDEEEIWSRIDASGDPVQAMLFLRAYPDSSFAPAARALVAHRSRGGEAVSSSQADQTTFEAAQAAADADAYSRYLALYPEGAYAELARAELAALAAAPANSPDPAAGQEFAFDRPLVSSNEAINGRSFAELIEGSPLYSPIEGLPEAAWMAPKTCSACHQWTRNGLCDQAQVYASRGNLQALTKPHPYGGGFKESLRGWAKGGCK